MRTSVPLKIIDLDDGCHLLVKVIVFNSAQYAVVDTGASRTVFDHTFLAGKLELLAEADGINATTLFSTTSMHQARLTNLQIGKLIIADLDVIALDLGSVVQTYEQLGFPPIVAVLGGDILRTYNAMINYASRRIILDSYDLKTLGAK